MQNNIKTIRETARDIPVTHEADLIIAGGGTAGVASAVCAARLGLSVIMIENASQPGGILTHITQWTNDFANKGGFASEFIENMKSRGIMQGPYYNSAMTVPYIDELLKEAGVNPLYLCSAVAPVMEDNALKGVIIESRQGRHAILGKIIIDATGDGAIAAAAGAEFAFGRADGKIQAVSLLHSLNNFIPESLNLQDELLPTLQAVKPDYKLPYDHGSLHRNISTERGLQLGITHTNCNPIDAQSLSDGLVELRRQATEFFELMNQTLYGEKLEYGAFCAIPGIRESRRIICDYNLTDDDVYKGTRQNDALFTVAQNVDIHRCAPGEPSIIIKKVKPYHLPYRSLLPCGLENIMVIGRCIGGSHEAMASYRIIADCFAMGEASALTAKQALDTGKGLRDINVSIIQTLMSETGYSI